MDNYFSIPAMSASAIKYGALSMLHMRHAIMTRSEPTAAMELGSIIHAAILEPMKLASLCTVWDGGDRRGNAWKDFSEENSAKIILKPAELARAEEIIGSVRRCQRAQELLSGCEYERVLQWEGEGYGAAKGRVDAIRDGMLVDVKTCKNISPRAVQSQAFRLGYHLQLGWYAEGAAKCGFHDIDFNVWLLYVETIPPYDVLPMHVGLDVVQLGQSKAITIARNYRECERAGHWPGVAGNEEVVLSLPVWEQEELVGFEEDRI